MVTLAEGFLNMVSETDLVNSTFLALMEHLPQGVFVVDRELHVRYWNRAAEAISGYSAEQIIGQPVFGCPVCLENSTTGRDPGDHFRAAIQNGQVFVGGFNLRNPQGKLWSVQLKIVPVRGPSGDVRGAMGIFSEASSISALQQQVDEYRSMAMRDWLTGAASRYHIEIKLSVWLERLRLGKWVFGALLMDLDGFKQVNDRHGHPTGDRILAGVARHVRANLRETDIFGRWAGDEFVILARVSTPARLRRLAEKLRMVIEQTPIITPAGPLQVTVSIGGTMARPEDTLLTLIGRADRLMYAGKQTGRNRVLLDGQ